MPTVEEHVSPDGLLYLVIELSNDDWSVGFKGLPWHTHGDILTFTYGGSPESAAKAFVRDVLEDQRVIVLLRARGQVVDAWVPDEPDKDEAQYLADGETIEKRWWSGG